MSESQEVKTLGPLAACWRLLSDIKNVKTIKSEKATLASDIVKLEAINARLASDIAKIEAHNEILVRERDWFSTQNQKLEEQLENLGAGPKLKFKIAPGMLARIDREAIINLAKEVPENGTIVDIGSLLGLSASLWCNYSVAGRIVCIDPWKYEPWLEAFRDSCGPITKENFLSYVPDERVETIQGYSPACAASWSDPIDLYWEDGDHNNPECRDSIRFWTRFVKSGGIACGHDYHLADVKTEVDALASEWGSNVELLGSVWWVKKG